MRKKKQVKIYKIVYNGRIYTGYNKDLLKDMLLKLKRNA